VEGSSVQPKETVLERAVELIKAYGLSAILLLVLFALWETVCRAGLVPHFIAPPPTEIIHVLFTKAGAFSDHFYATFLEVFYGYAAGLTVGLLLGIAIAYSSLTERTLYPLIVASQTIPIIAMGPILVLIFGFGGRLLSHYHEHS
jgi:ABC-type nitrate/sulfonate/bicarbonate transport system permease component